MKIVLNRRRNGGAYEVSENFYREYGLPYTRGMWGVVYANPISRTDSRLIEYIERKGSEMASTEHSWLVVVDVPDGHYVITNNKGYESITLFTE